MPRGGESLRTDDRSASRRTWPVLAALAGALLVAYWPALHGDFLWDDVAHLPEPRLRTWGGLARILFEPGTSQQYYPMLFGTFWAEYRLWGERTLGYHVVNVAMHGLGAALLWAVLRRLAIPGALLAAAVFALHPVHVESVAWICELKNTLSGVFYLAALLTYLVFDDSRRPGPWAASFALFLAAMLSKSVTGSLPAVILVLFWWKRGRLSWRTDVLPLLPLFAVSAGIGWFTARYEAEVVGASGAAFDLSFAARSLIAGRALWFYLGKVLWPVPLVFIYPRWRIDPTALWQWGFPAAALAMLVALWFLRRRLGRGPFAAAVMFAGTLFPASGFVNVYPFKFSFVADHFQYLASLGVIVPLCATLAYVARRMPRPAAAALGAALVALLGVLTWRQAHVYQSLETLWTHTVDQNPGSFLAQIGLGVVYEDQGRHAEAIVAEERAIAIDPASPEAHLNLARSYDHLGDYAKAAALYERGLALGSAYAPGVLPRLARLDVRLGQFDQAVDRARRAITLNPRSAYAYAVLGLAYAGQGRRAEAETAWHTALTLDASSEAGRIAAEQLGQRTPGPQ